MFCELENLPLYHIKRYMGYKKLKICVGGKNVTKHIKNNKTYDYIVVREKYFKKNIEHLLETLKLQYERFKNNYYSNLHSFSYKFYFNVVEMKNYSFFEKMFIDLSLSGDQNKELFVRSTFLNFERTNYNEKIKFLEKYAYQKTYYMDFINYLEKLIK